MQHTATCGNTLQIIFTADPNLILKYISLPLSRTNAVALWLSLARTCTLFLSLRLSLSRSLCVSLSLPRSLSFFSRSLTANFCTASLNITHKFDRLFEESRIQNLYVYLHMHTHMEVNTYAYVHACGYGYGNAYIYVYACEWFLLLLRETVI